MKHAHAKSTAVFFFTAILTALTQLKTAHAQSLPPDLDAYVASRPPSAEERAGFGAELRFAACRFAVTRITDVHLKQGAGAAPGKRFQRYLARLAGVQFHLDAADGLLAL